MLSLPQNIDYISELEAILEARMSFNQAYAEFLTSDISLEEKEAEFLPDCPESYLKDYRSDFKKNKDLFYQSMGQLYQDDYVFYKGVLETLRNNRNALDNVLMVIYLIVMIKAEVMYPKYRYEQKQNSDKYFELSSFSEIKSLINEFFVEKNSFEHKLLALINTFDIEYEKDKQILHFNTSKKLQLSVISSNHAQRKAWEDLINHASITGLLFKETKKCTKQENMILSRYQTIRSKKERNEALYDICNNLLNQKLRFSVPSNADLGQIAVFVHGLILGLFDKAFVQHLTTIQSTSETLKHDILKLKVDLSVVKQNAAQAKSSSPKKNTQLKKKKKKRNNTPKNIPEEKSHDKADLQSVSKEAELSSEQAIEDISLMLEEASLKQKTLLLAYNTKPMPFDRTYIDSNDGEKTKKLLEKIFSKDYAIKLDEIIGIIERLGGQVKINGSGSNHYRINLAGCIADFCHKHKPGSFQRRISAISKRIIFDVFKRAGIFDEHQAQVEYSKLVPASHRRSKKKFNI